MAKKKGKINEQARIQMEQANYRKMYFEKLQYYCDSYGGNGTFALIPKKYLETLFIMRIHPLKIDLKENNKINVNTQKYIHKLLYHVMHNMKVSIGNDLPDIRLDEFTIFVRTIIAISIPDPDISAKPWQIEFSKRLTCLTNKDVSFNATKQELELLEHTGNMVSNIQTGIVWFKYELSVTETKGAYNIAFLFIKRTTIKYFKFPDGSRLAHRVSWYDSVKGFYEISIKSSKWNTSTTFVDLPIEVYIQSHALKRLWERIDVYPPYHVQINMLISLLNPIIIKTGKNTGLIEYKIDGHKYGYLVCEYIDGDILIKTFLFLTNNGTPEGQKLNELTGLKKDDKKYLTIDRVSCFIASDIEHNESLKKLFIECGCESLIYAAQHLKFEKEIFSQYDVTTLILEYIKKEPMPGIEEQSC
jgi:hypothetical protein